MGLCLARFGSATRAFGFPCREGKAKLDTDEMGRSDLCCIHDGRQTQADGVCTAKLPRMPLIIILIILVLIFGGGGYYMGPGIGYCGGGATDAILIIVIIFLLLGRGRRI